MKNKWRIMKIWILFLLSFNSFALINLGTYTPNFLGSQTDKEGSTQKFALNPFVSVDYIFRPIFGYYFNPEIGYVFHLDAEDETTHKTIFLQYNFDVPMSSGYVFRWGFANYMDKIGGDGKTVIQKNGTGTATFYAPSETRTSYTSSLNIGIKKFVNNNYAIRFDTSIMSFLSSEKRGLSYVLSLNYN